MSTYFTGDTRERHKWFYFGSIARDTKWHFLGKTSAAEQCRNHRQINPIDGLAMDKHLILITDPL